MDEQMDPEVARLAAELHEALSAWEALPTPREIGLELELDDMRRRIADGERIATQERERLGRDNRNVMGRLAKYREKLTWLEREFAALKKSPEAAAAWNEWVMAEDHFKEVEARYLAAYRRSCGHGTASREVEGQAMPEQMAVAVADQRNLGF
jgi:nicotinamide mononucleotide adenylyltransferase